jgi:membrane-associated phospholipid phosphatase
MTPGRSTKTMTDQRRLQWMGLTALGFFVALSCAAAMSGVLPFDSALREATLIVTPASPEVLAAARWVNYGGRWQAMLPAGLLLLALFPACRHRWWLWALLLAAAPAVADGAKLLIARPRPEGVALGFPSGHATAAATFCVTVLCLVARERRRPWLHAVAVAAAVAWMLSVGWARVVLGAHWPSDVLGGFLLGIAFAALTFGWEGALAERLSRPSTAPAPGPLPSPLRRNAERERKST